jgi:hypothetical protein
MTAAGIRKYPCVIAAASGVVRVSAPLLPIDPLEG